MHLPPLSRALAPVATFLLAAFVFSGCAGYQLGSVKPIRLKHVEKLAVPTATNETLEPRIATNLTNHIIKAFQNDGTFQISSIENSDAIVKLEITDIERRQLRSARFNTLRSRELSVRMLVTYRIIDSDTGLPLDTGRFRESTNIFLDANFQTSERQAMDDVSRKVAADIVSRIAEGWPGEEQLMQQGDRNRLRTLRDRRDSTGEEPATFLN